MIVGVTGTLSAENSFSSSIDRIINTQASVSICPGFIAKGIVLCQDFTTPSGVPSVDDTGYYILAMYGLKSNNIFQTATSYVESGRNAGGALLRTQSYRPTITWNTSPTGDILISIPNTSVRWQGGKYAIYIW